MTPAEVLAAAADRLEKLAGEAAQDWVVDASNHLALPVIEMPYMVGPLKGQPGYTVTGPNDETTLYIAAMNPLVGKALAAMLRVEAELSGMPGPGWATDEAVDLARLIVGAES